MSSGDSFSFCDMSAKVLVRSTRVRRPSDALRSKMERCGGGLRMDEDNESEGGDEGGLKACICGARRETVGLEELVWP